MGNFFKSLLFGESEKEETSQAKRNFDVLKYDGIKALQMGKTGYAIRCFKEALKLEEEAETLEYLITACHRADETEEAIEAAGQLIGLNEKEVHPLLIRANLYYIDEQYAEAIADCEKALASDPDNLQAYFLMGKARKAAGNIIEATIALSQAITQKEDFAEARLLRAEVLLAAGDYQAGLEDAAKAIELLPEEENAYLIHGQLEEALGHSETAEKSYRYVSELNPFNEQAYLRLGSLYINRRQPEKAQELFSEAIEIKPDFALAYHERGRVRLMLGDKNGSLEDMKKAMELNPDEANIEGKYSNFEDMYSNRVL